MCYNVMGRRPQLGWPKMMPQNIKIRKVPCVRVWPEPGPVFWCPERSILGRCPWA